MSDNTKITIFVIIILLLLYSKPLSEVVTATVAGQPVTPNQNNTPNLGANDFDYSVCGIAPQVAQNNWPIRACIDPNTGYEYRMQDYPNGGEAAQVFMLRDPVQVERSILLNKPL